jgi:ubiquinone/menaquinone biosynthesis C-methylase UbiE
MTHEQRIRSTYNRLSLKYDLRWKNYVAGTLGQLVQWLNLKGTERLLDVACGTGAFEGMLSEVNPFQRVIGVDLSEKMLMRAKKKLLVKDSISFLQAQASHLPFQGETFDVVVSASAFHFFPYPEKPLSEMVRVLRKGGRLVVMDWCRDYLFCRWLDFGLRIWDPAHYQCYSIAELKCFFKDVGLKVSSEEKFVVRPFWGIMMVEGVK